MRRLIRDRKVAALAVAIAAVVLTVSIAAPAAGVPSIASIAKKAKRGLKVAKKADRRARRAQSTADAALARPVDGAAVRDVARTAQVPPGGGVYGIPCPGGFAPVGWGAIPVNGVDSFVVGASPVSGGYLIGIFSDVGDSVDVDATCVRSNDARLASRVEEPRRARQRLERELAGVRAARR